MDTPKKGKEYIVKVERISHGNGVVKSSKGDLYIENIDRDLDGEWVKVEYLGNNCLEVISKDVSEKDHRGRISRSNPIREDPVDDKNDLLGGHL